jgi:hypothetical protein
MTPYKNYSQPVSWQNRIKKGSLFIAVAAMIGGITACGNSDNGSDWEQVTVQEPTKGVVTTMEETQPGKYEITDEQMVEARDSSKIIIKKLDGTVQTLNLDQAKAMVQAADTVAVHNHYHRSHGFGSYIWWSAMGYMMGRNFGTPVYSGFYRNPGGLAPGSGAFGAGRGANIGTELQRSSVSRTVMRPVSGRSGFFGGSGRGRASGG